MTETEFVLGPWASLGVQVSNPFPATLNPAGPESKLNVSVFAGRSESVADNCNEKVSSSIVVRSGCAVKTGAVLTSLTMTVNEFVALNTGEPLSVTIVTNRLVLGP